MIGKQLQGLILVSYGSNIVVIGMNETDFIILNALKKAYGK